MTQDRDRVDRFLPLKPFVLDVLLELADGKTPRLEPDPRHLSSATAAIASCRRTSIARCARFAMTG